MAKKNDDKSNDIMFAIGVILFSLALINSYIQYRRLKSKYAIEDADFRIQIDSSTHLIVGATLALGLYIVSGLTYESFMKGNYLSSIFYFVLLIGGIWGGYIAHLVQLLLNILVCSYLREKVS